MDTIDRSEASRCLAKIIAYHDCGKSDQASYWTAQLLKLLAEAGIDIRAAIHTTRHQEGTEPCRTNT